MPEVTVNSFPGLAPNSTALDTRAIEATNVDFSGGGLRPALASSFVEAGHVGEIAYHNNRWHSGETNYLPSDIDGIPALIYKKGYKWRFDIGTAIDQPLWIDAPDSIKTESSELPMPTGLKQGPSGVGSVPVGEYEYFVKFREYDADGKNVRESDASAALVVDVATAGTSVKVTRPTYVNGLSTDDVKWVVYRRVMGDNYAREVGEVDLLTADFSDTLDSGDLGESMFPEARDQEGIEYQYVVVWVRSLSGWVTESTPSEVLPAKQSAEGVKIIRSGNVPEGVTGWRIYRISLGYDPTTTFQLVADLDLTTSTYLDLKDNIELTTALASSYRSDNGALVTAGIPDGDFDGMAGSFNGFFVGWNNRDLYLSEPGNPSWWPGAYVVQANAQIVGVTQVGSSIAVLTTDGVQYGFGTTPDSFVLGQGMFGTGGKHRTAIDRGYYLGHDGVYQILTDEVVRVSKNFGEQYFLSREFDNPWLLIENEQLFLTTDQGALKFDFRSNLWSQVDDRYSLQSLFGHGGEIYAAKGESIIKMFSADEYEPMNYEAAGLTFGGAVFKRIDAIRFYGEGSLTVRLKDVDGDILAEGEVDLDSSYRPDHYIYMPVWAEVEGVRLQISGKGTVRSAVFELMEANTEE